jgi:predicted RNA-binding Zn-ribbon protein involved in translation (DUF1610 family)
MKFICSECEEKTPVKSIQVERNLCRSCLEYQEGYTVPECPKCGYQVDMVRVDNHLYICPACGLCRSSHPDHLTTKGNPSVVCPIMREVMDMDDLERSHWHYEENEGHEESYIRISHDAHSQLHDYSKSLNQERDMVQHKNGIEVVFENLVRLDLNRLSMHHHYHPVQAGPHYFDYVLTRYAFPDYLDSTVLANALGHEHPGEVPSELEDIRQKFSKERRKHF